MKKHISLLTLALAIISIISLSNSANAATNENILIVFDASGSMTESFGGSPRIDVAKSAITDLLGSLDANTSVGLRAFAQEKITVKADACVKTDLLQPFTTDRSAVTTQVNSLQAVGSYTPLGYTLQQSTGDFAVGANNVLILMTDGQENCGGNPANAAAALKAAGIKVKTYVIGLGADAATRAQLTGIATAGGGKYYDATDATSLAASFNAIQQAEHPVDKTNTDSILGKEVTGGNGYETAVPITPGMYHLSHNQIGGQFDYFKMDVKAGDVINYSIQSSENSIYYDSKTNTFIEKNDHDGDYPGIKIYSATRSKLSSIQLNGDTSRTDKDSLTIEDSGVIYFLIGNDQSGYEFTNMSKGDIFTIKVTSPNASSVPATVGSTGNSSTDTDNSGTVAQQSGQNFPSPESVSQTVNSVTSGVSGIFYTILWIVVGAGILFVVIVVLIVYFIVKHNKTKVGSPVVSPVANQVTPSVKPVAPIVTPVVPSALVQPVTPPTPPVPPTTPQV